MRKLCLKFYFYIWLFPGGLIFFSWGGGALTSNAIVSSLAGGLTGCQLIWISQDLFSSLEKTLSLFLWEHIKFRTGPKNYTICAIWKVHDVYDLTYVLILLYLLLFSLSSFICRVPGIVPNVPFPFLPQLWWSVPEPGVAFAFGI